MAHVDLTPPSEVHAIALEAYKLWLEGGRALSSDALASLASGLEAIEDVTELFRALTTLVATALLIERQGDAASKDQILTVIKTQAPRFEGVRDTRSSDVKETREALARQLEKLDELGHESDR
jgi:hypothetical protein